MVSQLRHHYKFQRLSLYERVPFRSSSVLEFFCWVILLHSYSLWSGHCCLVCTFRWGFIVVTPSSVPFSTWRYDTEACNLFKSSSLGFSHCFGGFVYGSHWAYWVSFREISDFYDGVINSLEWKGDLQAQSVASSCLEFTPGMVKAFLYPRPDYVPMVSTNVACIVLQAFCSPLFQTVFQEKLNLLCQVRALNCYVHHSSQKCKSDQLLAALLHPDRVLRHLSKE